VRLGFSIRESLRRCGLNITERSAQLLLVAHQSHGQDALVDRRSLVRLERRNPRRARTAEVEAFVAQFRIAGPNSTSALIRQVQHECARAGVSIPSGTTVRRILADLPPLHQALAGMRAMGMPGLSNQGTESDHA
jgi:hypothetical protein